MKVLFRMKHGLGDNAQFTIVMRHIKHYYPTWNLDMEIGLGKASYFKNSTNNLFQRRLDHYDTRDYDNYLEIDWPPPEVCSPDLPSSKPTRFLEKVLKVKPIEKFYRGYDITITPKEQELADQYVANLPKPFVIVHYLAKTLTKNKSLAHSDAAFICQHIIKNNCTPVVLDWKNQCPLIDQKTIFNPGVDNPIWEGQKWSSAGTIAALINRAKLYIGVDSGPLHVAGATQTPTIGIWHGHHPVNFYDLCDNVIHFIPMKAKQNKTILGKNKEVAKIYFDKTYKHIYYDNLGKQLADEIRKKLT